MHTKQFCTSRSAPSFRSRFGAFFGFATSLIVTACPAEPPNPLDGLTLVSADPSDAPLHDLSVEQRRTFLKGDARFEDPFREKQGLGPLYIRAACASCHRADSRGPGFVNKMVVVEDDGVTTAIDQSLLSFGHTVRPFLTAGAVTPIAPVEAPQVKISTRIGPPVFGRGYMEAVRDDEIERIEREQQNRDDGISGRIHRVAYQSVVSPDPIFHNFDLTTTNLIGRFGLKGRIATLDDFTADAFQGDMGITSPQRPQEPPNPDGLEDDGKAGIDITSDDVAVVANYMRFVDIPARHPNDTDATTLQAGEAAFAQARCNVCHTPALQTRADYPVPQIAGVEALLYTDFLLHDMGDLLADGLPDGDATGREWRTPPLMGLRFFDSFMHDGRAVSIEGAIFAHEGPNSEANDSVTRYRALSADEKRNLLLFVEGL